MAACGSEKHPSPPPGPVSRAGLGGGQGQKTGSKPGWVARFWSKVDRSGPMGSCWPWTGYKNRRGYGMHGSGKLAHRTAYELAVGSVPRSLLVRHLCHNPSCCCPAHLEPGTHQDNSNDMVAAGRQTSGERNGIAKLSDEQVLEMRRRRAAGARVTDLAIEFSVTTSLVAQVCTGRVWRHLGGPFTGGRPWLHGRQSLAHRRKTPQLQLLPAVLP